MSDNQNETLFNGIKSDDISIEMPVLSEDTLTHLTPPAPTPIRMMLSQHEVDNICCNTCIICSIFYVIAWIGTTLFIIITYISIGKLNQCTDDGVEYKSLKCTLGNAMDVAFVGIVGGLIWPIMLPAAIYYLTVVYE
jgi:hypothetical protein